MYINVKLIDMDTKIPEQIVSNLDGGYTIFLNSKLNYEQLQKSYLHALGHIEHNDFEKKNSGLIEIFAHLENS